MIVAISYVHPAAKSVTLKQTDFRGYGDSAEDFVFRALRYCVPGVDYSLRVYATAQKYAQHDGLVSHFYAFRGVMDDIEIRRVAQIIVEGCNGQ